MDAKLEQMLIGELQPVVKFKRFEYTPMTDEDKEAMSKYIANPMTDEDKEAMSKYIANPNPIVKNKRRTS